ncbi:hypothetical protein C8Q80DRAFT_323074 [Daedaleopsis nitida]|nr:hypothetical protein C8Q80DRAFT_440299 [Daedaleopsis nitida]KAI0737430.1 hypothetical protein C8Q80DRAFT_323074 [Daedaleopsis nitida]
MITSRRPQSGSVTRAEEYHATSVLSPPSTPVTSHSLSARLPVGRRPSPVSVPWVYHNTDIRRTIVGGPSVLPAVTARAVGAPRCVPVSPGSVQGFPTTPSTLLSTPLPLAPTLPPSLPLSLCVGWARVVPPGTLPEHPMVVHKLASHALQPPSESCTRPTAVRHASVI